jgi:tetratricopeptide (TPR) repeat protein
MAERTASEKSVFLAAIEISSAAERAAYLDRACHDDPRLRAEVEALLRAHEGPQRLLEAPEAVVPTVAEAPRVERPGSVIGPYRLLQVIGEGGMGTVFMAEQMHPVRRKVALKLIKAGLDSRQVIARFEAERQALAVMDHVNIARVLDAGATEAGLPYFVMELVHGVPITKYCDDNHGKPVAKVIDFGVAKANEQKLTERTLFTQYGTMVGTLEYMSPEQAEMSALGVDTRSDIYSLGVLLYELLTGNTPLTHKRMKEAAYAEILRMIKEVEPPRPSTRLSDSGEALASISANRHMEPAKLTKLVRGELDWIVMKTLEKDRNRRYETAKDFAADVQRYLDDEPVQACPPSKWYRLRKFARRNKGRLAVAAGVFLAVTVMAASIGWAVGDRAARRAAGEQAEAARLATVGSQIRDSLDTARTLIAENKLAAAGEKLAQARAQLGNDWSVLGNLAAEVEAGTADLNRLQLFLDRIDQAHQAETAPLLERAWTADGSPGRAGTPASEGTRGRRPAAAVAFLLEALRLYGVLERDDWNSTLEGGLLGRQQIEQIRRLAYEELLWLAADVVGRQQEHQSEQKLSPEAAARQALVYLGKAESAHRPTRALYALRARCRNALGEVAAAQADTQLADKTPPTMALDHSLRGQAAYDAKQMAEAVRAFEAALLLEPTHYWSLMWQGFCLCDLGQGPEDFAGAARVFTGCILKRPDHAYAYYCRGNAYSNQRRDEEAVADYTRAIELDPKYTLAWYNRGHTYLELGQPDKAVADFSRALELDPKFANAWNNRGVAHLNLDQPDKAFSDFSRALELDTKVALAWTNRGNAYLNLDQLDKALGDFSRAIELDPKYAQAWYNRGIAHHKLVQPDKAVADYTRALELDPKFAKAWSNRGVAHLKLDQPDKAIADFSKAIELDPKFAKAWYNRGLAYNKLDQRDKAVTDYTRAIELDPKYALAWNNRGAAYLELGQPDKAVADCSRAVELTPKAGSYWKTLGMAHYRAGDWKAAVAALDKSRELRPGGDGVVQLFLAMAHRKLGNSDEARKAYDQAVQWLEKNKEALEKDKGLAQELRRFRAEAEEVLELKKK